MLLGSENSFEIVSLDDRENCRNRDVWKMSLLRQMCYSVLSSLDWELFHDLTLAFFHFSEHYKRQLD
jgi:hypothetical protein